MEETVRHVAHNKARWLAFVAFPARAAMAVRRVHPLTNDRTMKAEKARMQRVEIILAKLSTRNPSTSESDGAADGNSSR